MKHKKHLCLLLVLSLLAAMIAGCGSSKPAETTAPAVTTTPAVTTAPTEAPETEAPTQALDTEYLYMITDLWWARAFTSERNLIPEASFFTLTEDGTCTLYDGEGQVIEQVPFSLQGDALTIHASSGDAELRVAFEGLYPADDDSMAFVSLNESPFDAPIDQPTDLLEGRWYFQGSQFSDLYYEFSGDTYQKIDISGDEPEILSEGQFRTRLLPANPEEGGFLDVEILELGDYGEVLVLSPTCRFFFEDSGQACPIYIREDTIESGDKDAWNNMAGLVGQRLMVKQADGTIKYLRFSPFRFQIGTCVQEADGSIKDVSEDTYGSWFFKEGAEVLITYEDGYQEVIMAPDPWGTVYLENLDMEFGTFTP